MRVGILGTRGIPNAYGGFEQFAQYLALGLHKKGHETFVYNSSDHPYQDTLWNGVHIIHCRDWEKKIGTAGQFLYDYNCFRDASRREFDILLHLGYTSSSVWYPMWPKKPVHVINMDGLEWKRSKYNPLTRRFLHKAERWAVSHADILIADSIGIAEYLKREYAHSSIYIPYGAEIPAEFDGQALRRYDLDKHRYFLLMARMEPENNIELIIRGWIGARSDVPLVLIGNQENDFGRYLSRTYRRENLRFIGAIYDQQAVNALRHFALLYFHGHSVGGTNPSLLEAMACGCPIAAHDNLFNKAILEADAAYFTTAEDVTGILNRLPAEPMKAKWKKQNLYKIANWYNWDKIITDYEEVFASSLSNRLLTP